MFSQKYFKQANNTFICTLYESNSACKIVFQGGTMFGWTAASECNYNVGENFKQQENKRGKEK